jgi:Na+-driven multidrug efflux pump
VRVRRDEGAAILGIGGFAALAMVQFQATAFFVTGLVGQLGASAIAAYGAATRLELLQAPITFAFGSAVITLIATALGAGDTARARRITSTSMVVTASIGVVFMLVGLAGRGWMAFFTGDAQIRDLGALYLLTQAPVYPLYGAGLAAYFACQGAGEVKWPTLMVTLRLAIAVLGGWAALALTGAALPLFLMSSVGLAALGLGLIVIARARFSGI